MRNQDFPNSRALRKGRTSEQNRIYLVTFRCVDRSPLFADRVLAHIVADEIHRLDTSRHSRTFAFVVMPNHLHWLFELSGTKSLSDVVRDLKGRSSRQINLARQADGAVWQPGFHDRALRRVESLRETGFYIINNPVRAGLVEQWWDYPMLYIDASIAAEAAPTGLDPT